MWQQAVESGRFDGAEIDLHDGYIHFSAQHQVAETAAKHFSGRSDLVLLAVDEKNLGDDLRWEVSRGGDKFPHLYASLDVALVTSSVDLPLGDDGISVIPVIPDLDE